jgi:hypothetical protein
VPGGGGEGRGRRSGRLTPLGFDIGSWPRARVPGECSTLLYVGFRPDARPSSEAAPDDDQTGGTQPANIRGFTVADGPLATHQALTGSSISGAGPDRPIRARRQGKGHPIHLRSQAGGSRPAETRCSAPEPRLPRRALLPTTRLSRGRPAAGVFPCRGERRSALAPRRGRCTGALPERPQNQQRAHNPKPGHHVKFVQDQHGAPQQ